MTIYIYYATDRKSVGQIGVLPGVPHKIGWNDLCINLSAMRTKPRQALLILTLSLVIAGGLPQTAGASEIIDRIMGNLGMGNLDGLKSLVSDKGREQLQATDAEKFMKEKSEQFLKEAIRQHVTADSNGKFSAQEIHRQADTIRAEVNQKLEQVTRSYVVTQLRPTMTDRVFNGQIPPDMKGDFDGMLKQMEDKFVTNLTSGQLQAGAYTDMRMYQLLQPVTSGLGASVLPGAMVDLDTLLDSAPPPTVFMYPRPSFPNSYLLMNSLTQSMGQAAAEGMKNFISEKMEKMIDPNMLSFVDQLTQGDIETNLVNMMENAMIDEIKKGLGPEVLQGLDFTKN